MIRCILSGSLYLTFLSKKNKIENGDKEFVKKNFVSRRSRNVGIETFDETISTEFCIVVFYFFFIAFMVAFSPFHTFPRLIEQRWKLIVRLLFSV